MAQYALRTMCLSSEYQDVMRLQLNSDAVDSSSLFYESDMGLGHRLSDTIDVVRQCV